MADSIQEQIVQKMAQAISEVTEANGYANTIASVQRHNQSGVDLATLPTVLIREGDCFTDLTQSWQPSVRRKMEVFLAVIARQDEEDTTISGGAILNSLVADIEKRLAASQNWDGLAIMTDPPQYIEVEVDADTPQLTRGMQVSVTYAHQRGDPYRQ